jgi:hypothetical protein
MEGYGTEVEVENGEEGREGRRREKTRKRTLNETTKPPFAHSSTMGFNIFGT